MKLSMAETENKQNMKYTYYEPNNENKDRRKRILKTKPRSNKRLRKSETSASDNSGDVSISVCQKRKSGLDDNLQLAMAYAGGIMKRLRKTSKEQVNNVKFDRSNRYTLLRFNIINRLFRQKKELELSDETVYLAIHIFDQFLFKKQAILFALSKFLNCLDKMAFKKLLVDMKPFTVDDLRAVDILSVLALFIACKYQEVYPPTLQEFAEFSKADIKLLVKEELTVLETLGYCIKPTTEISIFNFVKNEVQVGDEISTSIYRKIKLGVVSGEIRNGYTTEILFGLFRCRVTNQDQLTNIQRCLDKYQIDEQLAVSKAKEFLRRSELFKKTISAMFL